MRIENRRPEGRRHTQSGKVRRRKKRRLSAYGWVLLVILLALCAVGGYWWFTRPGPVEKLDLTVLETSDRKAVKEGVRTDFSEDEVYPLRDYAFLGETLTLYQNPYDPVQTDPTLGKNVMLRNIVTGEEFTYTFGGGGDLGIQTGDLPEGVYELYLYEQYDKKRLYFEEALQSQPLEDIRRNQQVKSVVLDAGRDILADYDVTLDRNYAFLVVTDQVPRVKTVDVVLDPGGNLYNELTGVTDTGAEYQGTNEAQLAMELADLVAARLEAAGLKVSYTREDDDIAGYYGDAGRAAAGYSRQGKVFLSLVMAEDGGARPWFLTSLFVSGSLPSRMAYSLRQLGVELTDVNADAPDAAVGYDARQQNEDWSYNQFSMTPAIRETGGKITWAGQSGVITGNQMYQNAAGMYPVQFVFGNADSEDSMAYYLAHKEQIADGLAQGILDYYGIEMPAGDEDAQAYGGSTGTAQQPVSGQKAGEETENTAEK
ncbi:N-acetylmuramoyl-L-alanine amidase [uncultured Faecalibaculum sp.]|uniref:N-acetylmuramoyl-L-alanine amidase n=1 Tax=uncultured Faecalibaculum sp. TaxID=1729681 RepID=UPI00263716DB|nr:N-acetylmuramoyl-L-alanine amidase [uncultured Faecalibaculum sp.]